MYFSLLAEAVRARLLADTGTGGLNQTPPASPPLLPGGVSTEVPLGGANATLPRIMVEFAGADNTPAFTRGYASLVVVVRVIYEHQSQSAAAWAILDRVVGDGIRGGTSTYGLDRWTMGTVTAPAGWSVAGTEMMLRNVTPTEIIDEGRGIVTANFGLTVQYGST